MRAYLRPVVVATSLVAPLTLGAAWAAAAGPDSDATAAPTTTSAVIAAAPTTVAAPATSASAASVVAAAFQQTLSSPSRLALYTDIVGTTVDLTGDRPLATGALTPDGISLDVDLAPLFGLLGIEITEVDTRVQLIVTGPGIYVRAPLVSSLVADFGGTTGPVGPFANLGDGWGFVSFADMSGGSSGAPSDVGSILQLVAANPAFIESALESVPINELGPATINGVPVNGYQLVLSGDDGAVEPSGTPIEVWIGTDGYVHRIALRADGNTLAGVSDMMSVAVDDLESVGDVAAAAESGLGESGFVLRIDFTGYGATDIVIAPPASYVDLIPQPKS